MSAEEEPCPIWGTPSNKQAFPDRDAFYMDSPRAGGKYVIAGSTEPEVQALDQSTKARLTSWLIDQRRLGDEAPPITPGAIEDAKQRRGLPVYERADRLLRYLSHIEPFVGCRFKMNEAELLGAQAWSESRMIVTVMRYSEEEIEFFLDSLEAKGWIKVYKAGDYNLTVEGHAHLEELEHRTTDSSQAFVAMWFDGSMKTAWENGIERGIQDARYKARRIDRKEHVNKIDDEIIAEIRRSRFIVADFTHGDDGPRGGVYYEAGFAHGLGIPVIFTCRKDALEKVHFDTRQYNHIVWETPEELRRRLATRIAAVVGDGPLQANQAADSGRGKGNAR